MWWFWIAAAALAAGAASMVGGFAAAASRRALDAREDPGVAVHRRRLKELDALTEQGLMGPDEHRAARAEAARRLLSASDAVAPPWRAGGRSSRLAVGMAVVLAAAAALGLYVSVGSPGFPDEPFRARMAAWRRADPVSLSPDQLVAVLVAVTAERPRDPRAFEFLGRAELAAGDAASAATAFGKAAALDPRSAALPAQAGEAMTLAAEGKVTPEAQTAFVRALSLDPANPAARYFLARARIAAGDVAGGLGGWRALLATLPADDPRSAVLTAEIGRVARGEPLEAASSAPAPERGAQGGADRAAFIRSMVDGLAARLKAQPDDPAGWARIVRSYGVLGDATAKAAALAQARRLFKDRPKDLARVEAEAGAPAVSPAGAPGRS